MLEEPEFKGAWASKEIESDILLINILCLLYLR